MTVSQEYKGSKYGETEYDVTGFATCKTPGCNWTQHITGLMRWTRSKLNSDGTYTTKSTVTPTSKLPVCPQHPVRLPKIHGIHGELAPDITCGTKCRQARSRSCRCECAGTCHGIEIGNKSRIL